MCDYPELRNMLDEEMKALCLRTAKSKVLRRYPEGVRVGCSALFVLSTYVIVESLPLPDWLLIPSGVFSFGVGAALFWSMKRRALRRQLRVAIEELTSCCVACGYDLTGNQSGTCPECGQPAVARDFENK